MVTIIDYGAGNLKSVVKLFQHFQLETEVVSHAKKIEQAECLIFPGQGAFGSGMANLKKNDLISALKTYIKKQKPFLGICLGFQLLFEYSEEDGGHAGLGIFPGIIRKFNSSSLKVPHMGWNQLKIKNDYNNLFLPDSFVYFVHSFYLENTDTKIIAATTNYGLDFISAIQTPTLLGAQFHPEKSGNIGLAIMEKFLKKQLGTWKK